MTELEKKQLLVALIKTVAGKSDFLPNHLSLNPIDSTLSGLKEQLNFLMETRLELTVGEPRTGIAQSSNSEQEPEYFTKQDLVIFGNYLLSYKRYQNILNHPTFLDSAVLQERLTTVNDADLKNWKEEGRINIL